MPSSEGAPFERAVITLTTDFGDSAYAGALRGAILTVHPDARIVDVTHGVPAHDVVAGALALYSAAPFFPRGAIHVAVVDPGVGTARAALVVEAEGALFVGPDNGLLIPAAERLGLVRVRRLENAAWRRPDVSATFHARDVFGPAAARLGRGARPEDAGPETSEFVRLDFGRVAESRDAVEGSVIAVDPFGNVITNVPADLAERVAPLGSSALLGLGDASLRLPVRRTFGDAPAGEALLLAGSHGFLELAVNRGNAARTFGVKAGDAVRVARVT